MSNNCLLGTFSCQPSCIKSKASERAQSLHLEIQKQHFLKIIYWFPSGVFSVQIFSCLILLSSVQPDWVHAWISFCLHTFECNKRWVTSISLGHVVISEPKIGQQAAAKQSVAWCGLSDCIPGVKQFFKNFILPEPV